MGGAGAADRSTRESGGSSPFGLMIIFAVVLLLVGLAGVGALRLLQQAMRQPTADDLAQLVCTAYRTRNYDLLIEHIDPAPVPPDQAGAFNASLLRVQLQGVDTAAGNVTQCSYQQLKFNNLSKDTGTLQYTFVMRRTHLTKPIGTLMTLIHERDGTWKISRASNFTGAG